jgi:hypothetical protein
LGLDVTQELLQVGKTRDKGRETAVLGGDGSRGGGVNSSFDRVVSLMDGGEPNSNLTEGLDPCDSLTDGATPGAVWTNEMIPPGAEWTNELVTL